MMKKVLFVTASFYPDPYVGSVRVKEFSKWLPEYGWKPYVISKNYGFKASKEEFDKHVSPLVQISYLNDPAAQGVKSSNLNVRVAIKSFINSMLDRFILAPDPAILFWRSAEHKVVKVVEDIKPDVVITTGPPHSIHSLGLKIKKLFPETVWIADFRDVYRVGGSYRSTFWETYKHQASLRWEVKTYRESDGIICAIPEHVRWIRRLSPSSSHKVKLITNGAPVEFFKENGQSALDESTSGSAVAKVSVVGFSQCSEALCLSQAISKINEAGGQLLLSFVGVEPSYKNEISKMLPESSRFLGSVSHDKAIAEVMTSDVLVALLSKKRSRQFNLTSKLFEYCATDRPVLVINPTRPDKRFFGGFPGVWMLSHPSVDDICSVMQRFAEGDRKSYKDRVNFFETHLSRRKQARVLSEFMDEIVGV